MNWIRRIFRKKTATPISTALRPKEYCLNHYHGVGDPEVPCSVCGVIVQSESYIAAKRKKD